MVPAFTVFQTPEEPVATYHTLSFSGWVLMSAILPDKKAGPTLRRLKASKDTVGVDSVVFLFFRFCASRVCKGKNKNTLKKERTIDFISICF